MNPEMITGTSETGVVCVGSAPSGPKCPNIIANVEPTELGFLLETFHPASPLPFHSSKGREFNYFILFPEKTDLQLLDLIPSIPTCFFWMPPGHGQENQ